MLGSQLGRIINRAALSSPLSDLPSVSHPRSTTVTLISYTTSREILLPRAPLRAVTSNVQSLLLRRDMYESPSALSTRPCQLFKSLPYVFHARFLPLALLSFASFVYERLHSRCAYMPHTYVTLYNRGIYPSCNHTMPSKQS